jgi:ABC-type dipeptide/oligopeptide/nickel transport system ATPase component
VEVLGDASYGVHEGEVLGLVGESASDKSLILMGSFGLLSSGARVIGLGEANLPRSGRLLRAFRHELSRGMPQLAMLAAALIKTPHMLIADELLNGLDPSLAAGIMNLIRDLRTNGTWQ